MPNTSIVKVLTAEKCQFKALQHEMPKIKLDTTYANKATICFGSGIVLN